MLRNLLASYAVKEVERRMSSFTDDLIRKSTARLVEYDARRRQHPPREGRTMPELDDLAIGESRAFRLAVVSVDVRGFTDIAMQLNNQNIAKLAKLQALYLSEMSAVIRDYSGVTEKYTGDGVMGLFGTESETTASADVKNAMHAALTAKFVLGKVLNPYFQSLELPTIGCGIGIDYGPVLIERVGLRGGNQFSLSGPTASLAAKIQDHAPPGSIFVGNDVYKRAPEDLKALCVPVKPEWKHTYPVYHLFADWKE